MKKIGYILFTGLAFLLGIIPWFMLYFLAWVLYVFLYYIFGYRKKVVADNLQQSFPEKSETELRAIEKRYYKHLSQLMLEIIRMRYIRKKELERRVEVDQPELMNDLVKEGRNVLLLSGHSGNWEWAAMRLGILVVDGEFNLAYKTLTDENFDKFYKRMRSRFGNHPLTMNMMPRELLAQKQPSVTGVMADQTPSNPNDLWLNFLNRETLFFGGVEKLAVKTKSAIVFGKMIAERPGHYKIKLELVTKDASQLPEGGLMKDYVKRLENYIHEYPFNWLWSHRRWKHKKM